MPFDILLALSSTNHGRSPGDSQRARIEAKVDLWNFLKESIDDILAAYERPPELAGEIISATIWILHPAYEGPELAGECQLVLKSLKIPLPDNYMSVFTSCFQRVIIGKMRGQLQHLKGK